MSAQPAHRETADPYVGSVFGGRFEILERLGAGGMGAVYRGVQTSIGRKVAIKILAGDHEDPTIAQRFRNEALLASRLNHPNTVTIYDFGIGTGGELYIAMELVNGEPLSSIMSARAISWERAARIAVQICDSLHDAHQNGIVHRDLKPDNVMLTQRGHTVDVVKVLDFGIAKIHAAQDELAERQGLTRPNEVFGTPEYMSPEHARGASNLGPGTDIYALGVMLYEMVSGKLPFSSVTAMGMLLAHLTQPPAPLVVPESLPLPIRFECLIDEMLAKTPDARPASMADVGVTLRSILRDSGAALQPVPKPSLRLIPPIPTNAMEAAEPRITKESQPTLHVVETSSFNPGTLNSHNALADMIERFADAQDTHTLAKAIAEVVDEPLDKVMRRGALADRRVERGTLEFINLAVADRCRRPLTELRRASVMVGQPCVRLAAVARMLTTHLARHSDGEWELVEALNAMALAGRVAMTLVTAAERIEAWLRAWIQGLGRYVVLSSSRSLLLTAQREGGAEARVERLLGVTTAEVTRAAARHLALPERLTTTTGELGAAARLAHTVVDEASRATPRQWPSISWHVLSTSAGPKATTGHWTTLEPPIPARLRALEPDALAASARASSLEPQRSAIHHYVSALMTMDPETMDQRPAVTRSLISSSNSRAFEALDRGIFDLERTLIGRYTMRGVALSALKTLVRALGAEHAIFLERNREADQWIATYGLGRQAKKWLPKMRFPLAPPRALMEHQLDIFNGALHSSRPAVKLISTRDPDRDPQVSPWYRSTIDAPTLLLMPARVGELPSALIVATWSEPDLELPATLRARLERVRELVEEAVAKLAIG